MSERLPSLAALRKRYVDEARALPLDLERALRNDLRAGAKALLAAIDKRRHAHRAEGQRLRHMLRYEQALYADGITLVAGVDEAGMSPLAGPVVAAAVILPVNARLVDVDDSKKLDAATRDRLATEIKARAICWGVGIVEPEEIDRVNIYQAGLLAMRRAVEALEQIPEALLIDARRLKELQIRQEAIIKGDSKSLSIAAASILAKTTRDARMILYDAEFPGYGFAKHKGYPVPEHYEALEKLGACLIHRRSFAPVRKALGLDPLQGDLFAAGPDAEGICASTEAIALAAADMTTTAVAAIATAVADADPAGDA